VNGLVFDQLDAHGIPWKNYYSDLPSTGLFRNALAHGPANLVSIDHYFTDAAADTLPGFSLVDPPFNQPGSEEDPQNIQIGEEFAENLTAPCRHFDIDASVGTSTTSAPAAAYAFSRSQAASLVGRGRPHEARPYTRSP
jgi:hypothetical protein